MTSTLWMHRAGCAQPENRDLPWTEDSDSDGMDESLARVCASCPVRGECAAFARSRRVTAGVWAGRVRREPRTAVDRKMLVA